ncbi:MAG: glutamine-hydrolyzing carbamoyl-phosphate synthase small subunit [Thermoleophilia bacterium]
MTDKQENRFRQPEAAIPAAVVLEDGTIYHGHGFGAEGAVFGEIVFNTSMTGYQEIVTDPSYNGQMVTFTYPLIGNYGVSSKANESDEIHSRAVVVREAHNLAENCAADAGGWVDWLAQEGVVGVSGIDTRALTRRIRDAGAMRACVATGKFVESELLARVKDSPSMSGQDLAARVTCPEPYELEFLKGKYKVVVIDYGIKRSILKNLGAAGCNLTVLPAAATADEVLALTPDGVFLSNGPGDPGVLDYAVDCARGLLGKVPVFGICLGHQILSQALGLETYKLKYGHRGGNHPVKNLDTGKVEITSQNHGFAVELPAALSQRLEAARAGSTFFEAPPRDELLLETAAGPALISHLNLYDGTVEGVRCLEAPAFSVQYHPEASPGPHDSHYLFDDFIQMIRTGHTERA